MRPIYLFVLVVFLPCELHADEHRCDREAFGSFVQENYKDTRARVLERDAVGPISHYVSSSGKYIVSKGSWLDAWSGEFLENVDASEVHIDHIVPVCWAWRHGADEWDNDKRRNFYNDMDFLIVVKAEWNLAKGDLALDALMPVSPAIACSYATLFMDAVTRYELDISPSESAAFSQQIENVCSLVDDEKIETIFGE